MVSAIFLETSKNQTLRFLFFFKKCEESALGMQIFGFDVIFSIKI